MALCLVRVCGKVVPMASPDDVRKLAALARLSISAEEEARFSKEFDDILAYIGQIEKLEIAEKAGEQRPALRNVFREDGKPHEPGKYTEALAAQFPERERNYLSVKQIISYD